MTFIESLRRRALPPVSAPHRPSVWSAVFWLAGIDALWALWAGFRVTLESLAGVAITIGLALSPLLWRRLRAKPCLSETLLTLGGMLAFAPASAMLSYLVISLAPPLVDAQLVSIDMALAFDWAKVARWVKAHPWIDELFWWSYRSALLQIVVLVVVLGATGKHQRLREFSALFMAGGVFCIAFSALTPAFGPWHGAPPDLFDAAFLSHFEQLRDGRLRLLDLGAMQGLVSMPSFHTMGAVFLAYAMRGLWGWAPLYAVLNLLMVLSTPTQGGHYLADVLAGGFFAFAFIALSRSDLISSKDALYGYARVAAR